MSETELSDKKKENMMVLKMFGYLGILAANVLWDSWVLVKLWQWHVAPTFALPLLPFSAAVGLVCIMTLMATQYVPMPDEEFPKAVSSKFIKAAVILGIAWVAWILR